MSRYKRFVVHERNLISLFKAGEIHARCVVGLPQDAEFVRWFQDEHGRIQIVASSDSWPKLNDCDPIPLIDLVFETL